MQAGNRSGSKLTTVNQFFVPVLFPKMSIVTLSDALIQRLALTDRRILRDRVLSGFCLRLNKRTRTFLVATSSCGQQVRLTIGRWPLIKTDEARILAASLLRQCREGKLPVKQKAEKLPTLWHVLPEYAKAKGLKASSLARYESILKVHFPDWQHQSVQELASPAFSVHCHEFAQTKGNALVEVGRGLIGALIRYVNAIYRLNIESPFNHLAAAGLMPERAAPRERRLQESGLARWYLAVQQLADKQRDLLMLLALTGLRRNEAGTLQKRQVDFVANIIDIPETKTGQPHTLPITDPIKEILTRRCADIADAEMLFAGVSLDHVAEMAMRAGAPKFMLHDLRKMLATTGELLGFSDAVMRRILNHKAQKADTLHRHYVRLSVANIHEPLTVIQRRLLAQMQTNVAAHSQHKGGADD